VALDGPLAGAAACIEIGTADMRLAASFLRRLDLPLKAPDAINIAAAMRPGAALAIFDTRMEAAARTLGCDIAPPTAEQMGRTRFCNRSGG